MVENEMFTSSQTASKTTIRIAALIYEGDPAGAAEAIGEFLKATTIYETPRGTDERPAEEQTS